MNLVNWLNTPPKSVFWLILWATGLYLVYTVFGVMFSGIVESVTGSPAIPDWIGFDKMSDGKRIFFIVFMFVGAPLNSVIEELLFRAPWLTITGKLFPRGTITIVIAILTSVIFGCIHGGIATIPVQGALGIILSFCYLKCGGQDGKFWKPLSVVIVIHTLANWVLLAVGGTAMIAGMMIE